MTKRMLVDATHPEETRVAIVDDRRLEDFDFESASKKQLKGNIYLAKVVRIEPSLQAAFVEYGGNRHGFLPFSEIHPDYYRIPVGDRPHDDVASENAEEADDENFEASGLSEEAYAEELRAYQADLTHEREHSHIDHPVVDPSLAAQAGEETPPSIGSEPAMTHAEAFAPVSTEMAVDAPAEHHLGGLGPEAGHELGLITDFGNAAVDPGFAPHAPIEVVGGEVADEVEERVRRHRPRSYKIQEVVKRRQIMLIQVVKEERGNKGAALTTFLSLAGRYCVLMPNTDRGGGVSRKITSHQDRKRMKEILDQLETPEGMAVILRTAGMEQEPAEIQRDLEHLLRLWNNIREQTLASTAPTLIYEEANLIKRSIRDLFAADVEDIIVAGGKGYTLAHDFMRSIMPEQADKVRLYEDSVPLFFRYNVEKQIDQLYNPVVQLRSGGYIVINPTEALVSIDVNSGRATRERHIEGTALKTNLEAAEEVARQLRLRDLAGLIVIDFIDMEDGRNNAAVERRMKESMKADRARLQIGPISPFGLMELSRQRLHPSLTEINFEKCPHCAGVGMMRTVDSSAISILRMIEEEGIKQSGGEMVLHVPTAIALYILNQKRAVLHGIEQRYNLQVFLRSDDTLVPPDCKLERMRAGSTELRTRAPAVNTDQVFADGVQDNDGDDAPVVAATDSSYPPRGDADRQNARRRGRFGRGGRDRGDNRGENRGDRNGRDRNPDRPRDNSQDRIYVDAQREPNGNAVVAETPIDDNIGNIPAPTFEGRNGNAAPHEGADGQRQGGRRRGRRGGRGRRGNGPREDRPLDDPTHGETPGDDGLNAAPRAYEPAPAVAAYAPTTTIPLSIHDIDTTPRETREPRTAHRDQAASPLPYQVIDHPLDDKPKGGWWRKLTGQ